MHWSKGDCGHGIGRQHNATKYNETNNHFQCKKCNGFESGQKDIYAMKVDTTYGPGTWNKLQVASRQVCKRTNNDRVIMYNFYKAEVERLQKEKNL